MKFPRRTFLHLIAGAAALPAVSRVALALDYPTRPVRIIVGFPAGSAPDIIARLMGQWLVGASRPAVRRRKPAGCRQQYRDRIVVRAPPDGYTLLWPSRRTQSTRRSTTTSISISSVTSRRSRAWSGPPSSWWSIHQFRPGRFPSSSRTPRPIQARSTWRRPGSAARPMSSASCSRRWPASTCFTSRIAAVTCSDLLGGQVQVAFASASFVDRVHQGGKLRALAVTTAARLDALPDVPTVGEFRAGL